MSLEAQFCKIKGILEMDSGDGCNNNVNIFNATELYIWKWLRWQMSYYVYFTTIKKKKTKLGKKEIAN